MRREVGRAGSAGFTIIEVILFLAISSALVIGLLATVGSTISRQRFTDSVTSTQAFLQSGYNETLNVINDRSSDACSVASGTTVVGSGAVATNRGASNCVVLGKALDFTPDGSVITTHTVIGTEPTTASTDTGADLLKRYAPGIDTSTRSTGDGSTATYDLPWGAQVIGVRQNGSTERATRVLLLRSPDSGLVLTFGDNGGTSLIGALTSGAHAYNLCLKSADIINAVSMVALSSATGAEGVTTRFDLNGTAQGSLC